MIELTPVTGWTITMELDEALANLPAILELPAAYRAIGRHAYNTTRQAILIPNSETRAAAALAVEEILDALADNGEAPDTADPVEFRTDGAVLPAYRLTWST